MKKILLSLLLLASVCSAKAGEGDTYVSLDAGLMYEKTLNATFSFEKELRYNDAWALFIEAGDKWQIHEGEDGCGKACKEVFWKNYYWQGGALYKKVLKKYKNSFLRLDLGADAGAYRGDFSFGLQLHFEYNIVLPRGVQIVLAQRNNVSFIHGDTFRNGFSVGLKFPL